MRNFRKVFTIRFNTTSFAVGRTHKVTLSGVARKRRMVKCLQEHITANVT